MVGAGTGQMMPMINESFVRFGGGDTTQFGIADWTWDPFADLWDSSLLTLKKFAKREGHAQAPQRHIENGIDLGSFVNGCRNEYKRQTKQRTHQTT